jgi:hypothetical protein
MLFDRYLVFGSGHFCYWHYADRPIATDNLQQVKPEPIGGQQPPKPQPLDKPDRAITYYFS